MKFIERVFCRNSVICNIAEGTEEGKNSRGRPPLEFISRMLKKYTACRSYYEFKKKSEEHDECKRVASQLLTKK